MFSRQHFSRKVKFTTLTKLTDQQVRGSSLVPHAKIIGTHPHLGFYLSAGDSGADSHAYLASSLSAKLCLLLETNLDGRLKYLGKIFMSNGVMWFKVSIGVIKTPIWRIPS